MRKVVLKYYVNKFGTYLFISQLFLNDVIWSKEKNTVTLPHSAQRKRAFLEEMQKMSKTKKFPSRKTIAI